jgi:SAM-dependent methyltransferase
MSHMGVLNMRRHHKETYFERAVRPYHSLPPESGRRDEALIALARRVDLSRPALLLDYGCGRGRLLAALLEARRPEEIVNLHYIGVDASDHALAVASNYFRSAFSRSGAKACFLSDLAFAKNAILVDHVAIVFALHELDPVHLDRTVAALWRMVRRGGSLLIQDVGIPVFKEIEYIAFDAEEIEALLRPLQAEVHKETTVAGLSRLPVYLVEVLKPRSWTPYKAYRLADLSESYRDTLHRSVLADCFAFLKARREVDGGRVVDPDSVAAIAHRIAMKTRAFHQTKAMDEVNSHRAEYCVACGSMDVAAEWIDSSFKDPGELTVDCRKCGYRHYRIIDDGCRDNEESLTEELFIFLDEGSKNLGNAQMLLMRCASAHNEELLRIIWPFLALIPGVTPAMLEWLADGPPWDSTAAPYAWAP